MEIRMLRRTLVIFSTQTLSAFVLLSIFAVLTACSNSSTIKTSQQTKLNKQTINSISTESLLQEKTVKENKFTSQKVKANLPPVTLFNERVDVHFLKFSKPKDTSRKNNKVSTDEKTNLWEKIATELTLYKENSHKPLVNHFIRKYADRPKLLKVMASNAVPYLPFIYEEIKKRNMPMELALLPFVESGFFAKAVSHKNAAGLWQFTRSTGKYYGLKQNWWYDERLDIYTSTRAALNFLQDLHFKYKDWFLVLSAYNYGSGNLNQAMKKAQRKNIPIDYWTLELPKETRHYIPKLLAYSHLIANTKSYDLNIKPIYEKKPLITVKMSDAVPLSILAKASGISLKKFKKLNPGFRRWAPKPKAKYSILLPQSQHQHFNKKIKKLLNANKITWGSHRVKRGDTLYDLAIFYGVKIKALISANKIRKNGIIRPGDRLVIPR
jgi:membrane-bound lytic murein transglycosylase D